MRWGITTTELVVAGGAFVASTVITSAIVGGFLVSIRPDYFVAKRKGLAERMPSAITRHLYVAGKNLLGVMLVLVGVLLSLPGVPGQGLLTILVGMLLIDIPGKRRFELAIVRRPRVLDSINRLRARFGRESLRVTEQPAAPTADGAAADGAAEAEVDPRQGEPGGDGVSHDATRHEDMADS